MRLFCPTCGTAIPAADMNLANALAKCRACDSLFAFADAGFPDRAPPRDVTAVGRASGAVVPVPTPPGAAPIAPCPPGMSVEDWGGALRISWRWFRWDYVGLLLFCVFWDGFLIFWYSIAFAAGGPLVMKVFPILHVAVGVSLTYSVLTGFLNRTTVEVLPGELTIRHRPLPWVGNRRLPVSEVEQLFVEESGWTGNNDRRTFSLSAALTGARKVRLLGGFRDPGEPRFLEQQLERRLGIKPAAVVGEYAECR